MLVSISISGSLNANTRTALAVYSPTPGNASKASMSCGRFPACLRTMSFAASCRNFARRLYPRPLQTLSTSKSGAFASARTFGNAFRNSRYFPSTLGTCVCWSITSETRILYGSRVFLHAKSWRPLFFQYFQTSRRKAPTCLEVINDIFPFNNHFPLLQFRVAVELHVRIEADGARNELKHRNIRFRISHPDGIREREPFFLDGAVNDVRLVVDEMRVDDISRKAILRTDLINSAVRLVETKPRTEFVEDRLRRMRHGQQVVIFLF